MSIFSNTFRVLYRFRNKEDDYVYDSIKRFGEKRVPNIGESIHFICRGNRKCKVVDVTTDLTHDPNECTYIIDVEKEE